ncbi:MAG: hypothetical protein MK160_11680 [Rhodobacteraceae bacterium]|nr:hypothetical protein [Paracoccaceae bacterium]
MTDVTETTRTSVFLERQTYRRRRLVDAARLVPVLGLLLWLVPLLWPSEGDSRPAMSTAILYLFGVWIFLVVIKFLIARPLRSDPSDAQDGQE